jgi:hypothetical protein
MQPPKIILDLSSGPAIEFSKVVSDHINHVFSGLDERYLISWPQDNMDVLAILEGRGRVFHPSEG